MSTPANPRLSARKQPRQQRSTEAVAAILQAAAQVLAAEGAARFTTARVAERAGISIGSLYQYFPNKAAILFRLQSDEWRDTRAVLTGLLADTTQPSSARLRAVVRAFVVSECEEAAMRQALDDAAPLYRDAPEAQAARAEVKAPIMAFLTEAAPNATTAHLTVAGDTMVGALKVLGKALSQSDQSQEEIAARTEALADMLCAYLATLEPSVV
ncbi:TetR family transcriptional regulator [Novosphingobium sediminicola]|uniref:AcrR family transcriptional regulator n=1 Tax=Novosphingobium sediminicola TaxID=563162 RepID=A0A7W6CIQ9_9SPHN|nr:TetR family transcriptional regulator [Novosphingobium sediminicola]MBB3957224.1 AcrR family transcriptional regulator [Novosphingobium sediminicola]